MLRSFLFSYLRSIVCKYHLTSSCPFPWSQLLACLAWWCSGTMEKRCNIQRPNTEGHDHFTPYAHQETKTSALKSQSCNLSAVRISVYISYRSVLIRACVILSSRFACKYEFSLLLYVNTNLCVLNNEFK